VTATPTARSRRARRSVAAAALLALAVVGLSACDPREAGSAAVVGGYRVTETSVNHDAEAVLKAFDKAGTPPPANDTLLRTLIDRAVDDQLVAVAAKREGITVTQGQIDTLIDDNGGRVKLSAAFATRDGLWLPPGQIDDLARSSLAQVGLGNKLAPGGTATAIDAAVTAYKAKLAKELGVSISPRYGSWDPKTLQITGNLDDLSVPAAGEPSASPSAG
jgi:hypothetical protein